MSEVSGVSETPADTVAIYDDKGPIEDPLATEETAEIATTKEIDTKHSFEEQLLEMMEKGGSEKQLYDTLKGLFGEQLVKRAFQSLKFPGSNWSQRWPTKIEPEEALSANDLLGKKNCLLALAAIGHCITVNDLDEYFAELKSGNIQTPILKHAQISYLRLCWSSAMNSTVRDLPPFWINHLLDLFRNPLKTLSSDRTLSLSEEIEALELEGERATSLTYYDHAIKKLHQLGDRSKPEFFFASKELIAKFIAYGDTASMQEGMIIPYYDEKSQQLVYYTLESMLHDSGLHGYLFTPIDKTEDLPAFLTFRGTDSTQSLARDMDTSGVGRRTFNNNAETIRSMVRKATIGMASPRLEVIGHSLAGADSQRTVATLLDPEQDIHLKEIKLYAFCSPKLDSATITQWRNNLSSLKEMTEPPHLEFNFAYHEQDMITWTGYANLCGAAPYYIPCSYLIVASDSGYSKTDLHHTRSFFKNGNFDFETDNRSFRLLQTIPNDELQECLKKLEEIQNTSYWYRKIKSFLYWSKEVTEEELKGRIAEIQKTQLEIKEVQANTSETSWLLWTASEIFRHTVQPVVHYIARIFS